MTTPLLIPTQESDEFLWTTQLGERLKVSSMTTSHIFNVVRMLYNHNVPAPFQVFHRHRYKINMSKDSQRSALNAMLFELSKRTDLTDTMKQLLQEMANNIQLHTQRKLS